MNADHRPAAIALGDAQIAAARRRARETGRSLLA